MLGGFGVWHRGAPFVTAGDPHFGLWSRGAPYVASPAGAVEIVSATVVLSSTARDVLTGRDRPTATIVFVLSATDQHIVAATYTDIAQAIFQIIAMSTDRQAMRDRPTAPIIVVPVPRDILAAVEHPRAVPIFLPRTFDIASVERMLVEIRFVVSVVDFRRSSERVLSEWNESSDAALRRVVAEAGWNLLTTPRETDAADNIGEPGQTYQAGGATRRVSSVSGRRQGIRTTVSVT